CRTRRDWPVRGALRLREHLLGDGRAARGAQRQDAKSQQVSSSVGRLLGIVAEVDASLSQPIDNRRELCGADGKRHTVTWSRWLADEQDGAAVVEAHVEHVLVGPVRQRWRKPQNLCKPPR